MSWTEFRNSLLTETKAKIWAQWSALGARSTGQFKPVAVDLEALLVGTWSFGRTEPRLFDEALNWCCQFGDLVNVKRLEKLLGEASDPVLNRVGQAWAEVLGKHGEANWKLGVETSDTFGISERLFLTDELKTQSTGPRRAPIFEEQGLIRGPFEVRRHATPPEFSDLQLAQLFARKFMGGGCRSEVFGLLLLGVDATTTDLAEMTVYSRRSVQGVLRDLKTAGLLDWESGRGRTTRASLYQRVRTNFKAAIMRDWAPEEPFRVLEVRDWPGFFLGLHRIWQAVLRIEQSGLEGFKAQSLFRDALEEATEYHRRTSLKSVHSPRLAAESMEELSREVRIYLDSLFAEEANVSTDRSVTGRRH